MKWNLADEIAKVQSQYYTRKELRIELRNLLMLLSKNELTEELNLTQKKLKKEINHEDITV
jgi:hypothetical protein